MLFIRFRVNIQLPKGNSPTEKHKTEDITMSEKTTKQITEMKKQTIGVEVEMNNITRKDAAKVAADFFGTSRVEYTGGRNGYETFSAWDGEGREWKFQKVISPGGGGVTK